MANYGGNGSTIGAENINEFNITMGNVNKQFGSVERASKAASAEILKMTESIRRATVDVERAAQIFNKNIMFVSSELKDNFIKAGLISRGAGIRSQFAQEMYEISKAISNLEEIENSAADDITKSMAQRKKTQLEDVLKTRSNMTEIQILNKKYLKANHDLAIDSIKKTLTSLTNYATNLLNNAYSSVVSSMKSNYNTITSYQSYDAKQFSELMGRLKDEINALDLNSAINIEDVQNSLADSLKSGLQGAVAESNALYASIASKAGITFDWTSSEWTKMIDQMSRDGKDYESVMKAQISTAKGLTEYYGSGTGLANGQINTITSFASDMARTYGLNENAYNELTKSMMVASQELANAGIDSSSIFQIFQSQMEKGLISGNVEALFGTNMNSDQIIEAMRSGNAGKIVKDYMNTLESLYSGAPGELISPLSSELGSTLSTQQIQALQTYFKGNDFKSNFDAASQAAEAKNIDEITDNLSDYIDKETEYQNSVKNSLTKIETWAVDHPIGAIIAQSGMVAAASAIGLFGNYLMDRLALKTVLNAGGSGLGNTNNYMQPPFPGFENTNATSSLRNRLFTTEAGGTRITGLTKGAKTGLKIGGTALGVGITLADVTSGFSEGGLGGAVEKGLTGQTGEVDSLGQALLSGAKNTAKGAALGSFGGVPGILIGGAIGAVAGFGSSLAKLYDPMNQLRLSVEGNKKALDEQQKAVKEAQVATQKNISNEKALNVLKNKEMYSQDEQLKALEELKETYPELISKTAGLKDIDDDYIKILEYKLQLEKEDTQKEFLKRNSGSVKKISKSAKKHSDSYTTGETSGFVRESATYYGGLVAKKMDEGKSYEEALAEVEKENGLQKGELGSSLSYYVGSDDGKDLAVAAQTTKTDYQNEAADILEEYRNFISMFSGKNEDGIEVVKMPLDEKQRKAFVSQFKDLVNSFAKIRGGVPKDRYGYYGISKKKLRENSNLEEGLRPQAVYDTFLDKEERKGIKTDGLFATGTNRVPYDNYVALLHRDEQVRTAAEVAIDRAEEHIASSATIATLDSTVLRQTNSIISILTDIYDKLQIALPNYSSSGGGKKPIYDLPSI